MIWFKRLELIMLRFCEKTRPYRHKACFGIGSIIFHHFAEGNQTITRRFDSTDRQWEKICPFLPGQKGRVGQASPDTRLFVNAVIWRYRTGSPWRDVPEVYGDLPQYP